MAETDREIAVTRDDLTLPIIEILTGRGFITGKSGSGKSNTASVIAESLLDQNLPVFIIDTDGEYYGLKEEYELLHVGGDTECDVTVDVTHAEAIATLALEDNVPIILDVSGYLEEDRSRRLITETLKHLFSKEKRLKKPFLVFVEEAHEFIPQQGGLDDLGQILIRIAKRGRKRGLGLCAMSQRPAAVDKDYITQCDWIVWHRLTWDNDTRVVENILGPQAGEDVQDLDDGQAILMTDWDERTRTVRFKKKSTFDAGATPGLEDFDRPDLKSVSDDLVARLEQVGDGAPGADGDGEATATESDDSGGAESEASDATPPADRDSPDPGGTALSGDALDDITADPDAASPGETGPLDRDGSSADASTGRGGLSADRGRSSASRGDDGRSEPPDRENLLWELGQLVKFVVLGVLRLGYRSIAELGWRLRRRGRRVYRALPARITGATPNPYGGSPRRRGEYGHVGTARYTPQNAAIGAIALGLVIGIVVTLVVTIV
ncbi:MAG: helicase HerA domain-containing protein [Halococcoides sp.]